LFKSRQRFIKYFKCILIGLPLWFGVGVLITLSPEFGKELNVKGVVSAGTAVAVTYGGTVIGDICSGLLSQYLKSRIKVVALFLMLTTGAITAFLFLQNLSLFQFYTVCALFGFAAGYWVLFLTIAAEQFGTNIRATVTTTVPNFVRGAVVPLLLFFQFCKGFFNGSLVSAGIVVGALTVMLAFWALLGIKESFATDLDYTEDI
jgi:MFS family permease